MILTPSSFSFFASALEERVIDLTDARSNYDDRTYLIASTSGRKTTSPVVAMD